MLPLLPILLLFGQADSQQQRAEAIIAPEQRATDQLVRLIASQRLTAADRRSIQRGVAALGSAKFLEREAATARLIAHGAKAFELVNDSLRRATAAQQPERVARLRAVLSQCDPADERQRLWAAAVLLSVAEPAPQTSDRLLRVFPGPTWRIQIALLNAVQQHLPAAETLAVLKQEADSPELQAAQLIFRSQQEPHAQRTAAMLESIHPRVQLAAARVTTTVNPARAANLLVELCTAEHRGIQDEAMSLLRAFHRQLVGSEAPRVWQADDWGDWIRSTQSRLKPLAPETAYRWGQFTQGLREDFAEARAAIRTHYRDYTYQHTVAAKAKVADGRLFLRGDHDEGDQRLAFAAEQIVGTPSIEHPFTVQASLGGTPGNPIGWHVGVSVGNAKFLFHPDYAGGAFRVEHCDSHRSYFNSASMSFTPASNKLYKMKLAVRPQKAGAVRVDVLIEDPDSKSQFSTQVPLTAEQIGPITRVALERSGRAGGDAMFDYVEIRLDAD